MKYTINVAIIFCATGKLAGTNPQNTGKKFISSQFPSTKLKRSRKSYGNSLPNSPVCQGCLCFKRWGWNLDKAPGYTPSPVSASDPPWMSSSGRPFSAGAHLWLRMKVTQMVKNLPAMQETRVRSLGQEDPLEKGMVTHCRILAWRTPWTEEPGVYGVTKNQTGLSN